MNSFYFWGILLLSLFLAIRQAFIMAKKNKVNEEIAKKQEELNEAHKKSEESKNEYEDAKKSFLDKYNKLK